MKRVVITAIVLVVAVCSAAFSIAIYRHNGAVTGQRAFRQGYALMDKAEYAKAIPFFTACARGGAGQSWTSAALNNRGFCYYQLRQYDKAIDNFTAALQIEQAVFPYKWRGLAYERKNRPDLAFADDEKALQLDPNLADIWYREGVYHEGAGNYQMARAAFREAIRSSPDYVDAHIESGYSSSRLGDRDGALSSYEAAIQIDPQNAVAYSLRGKFYREQEQYERAIADLTRAIQLAPKDKRHYERRAVAYEDMEKYREAIEDLSRVLELDRSDEWALERRGLVYREQKDYPRAIADFTKLIKGAPSADIYNDRARTYAMAGQYQLALADYKEEKQQFWTNERGGAKSMAWFLATCPDATFRNGAEAVAEATKDCEETAWKDPYDLDTMAAAEAEAGRFEEAASYEEKALALLKGESRLRKRFVDRLALYRSRKPFHEEPSR